VLVIGKIPDRLGSFQELLGLGHPACDQGIVTRLCSSPHAATDPISRRIVRREP
jgi:hypothetical protein